MKTKVLAVLGLAAVVGFGACKGSTNTNTMMNTNTNTMTMATPSPIAKTTESAMTDSNLKPKIEADLKAKGFTDITVDTSGPKTILRGTVAKDKMPEVMSVVQMANGGKPVDNQLTLK